MPAIVVGVDGSEASMEALRFAFDEGRRRGAEVKVVKAWEVPPLAYGAGWSVPVHAEDYEKVAETEFQKIIEDVAETSAGVTVTPVLCEGQAASVLCAQAADADLLVVGSRGLGGFRGLLLGSVSQECAHHAPCPVVIIPHERGETS
jgi:nucleotide-binding universal stress UspA family protein